MGIDVLTVLHSSNDQIAIDTDPRAVMLDQIRFAVLGASPTSIQDVAAMCPARMPAQRNRDAY